MVELHELPDPAVEVARAALELRIAGGKPEHDSWGGLINRPTPEDADKAILHRNISRRMNERKWTPRHLSLEANLNAEAIRHILTGRIRSPRGASLKAIADALNCTAADLTGDFLFLGAQPERQIALRQELGWMFLKAKSLRQEALMDNDNETRIALLHRANKLDFLDGPYEWRDAVGAAPWPSARPGSVRPLRPNLAPTTENGRNLLAQSPSVGPGRMLPIYQAAQGGSDGAHIMDWNPVDYKPAPGPLEMVRDAYGFIVVDDSMDPAYVHGDIVFPHPHARPSTGRNAIFIKRDADGASYVLLKRLEGITDSEWRVRQYNPDRKFSLKRSEWQQCFMVLAKYDRQ